MLKCLIFGLSLCISSIAVAADCVDQNGNDIISDPTAFTALIEKASSCYEATQLAEACAWGSSVDVQTAGTAYQVCSSELAVNKPSKKLLGLLDVMRSACTARYDKEEGSLARAVHSYCHLTAINFVNNLAGPF